MSELIAEVVQWPDNSGDPLRQNKDIVAVCINPEAGYIELGVDAVKMPAGRVYLRFAPEELVSALALAMFNRDE